jgi:5-methylcytosine-specific restriction endonuclease McrA
METRVFWELGRVSDEQLRAGLATLLASGYRTDSAHRCAHRGGRGAKAAIVFAMIERREIHLTGVCLLRDYLTPENHLELLAEASGKTKLQVQELLARRFPRPDVASYVRKLPAPAEPAKQTSTSPAESPGGACEASEHSSFPPTLAPPPPPPRSLIEPTSEARYRIQLNASAALKEKLELFQALVSHSVPNGDVAAVLERALDLALEQVQKRRFAKTDKPRNSRPARGLTVKRSSAHREHIPNATRRDVAARDELQCNYVSDGGCRCSTRAFLQIHHEKPWARGGSSRPENLRLLCAVHNRLLAERDFGAAHVAARLEARRGESGRLSKEQGPARPQGARSSANGMPSQARMLANRTPSRKADDLVGPAKPEKRDSP